MSLRGLKPGPFFFQPEHSIMERGKESAAKRVRRMAVMSPAWSGLLCCCGFFSDIFPNTLADSSSIGWFNEPSDLGSRWNDDRHMCRCGQKLLNLRKSWRWQPLFWPLIASFSFLFLCRHLKFLMNIFSVIFKPTVKRPWNSLSMNHPSFLAE